MDAPADRRRSATARRRYGVSVTENTESQTSAKLNSQNSPDAPQYPNHTVKAQVAMRQTLHCLAPYLVLALLCSAAHAQSTWTGLGGNNLWGNAGNWNTVIPPLPGSPVTFVGPVNNVVDLGANRVVSTLTFDATVPFTLLNNTLSINGGVTTTNSIAGGHDIFSNVVVNGITNWSIGENAPLEVVGNIGGFGFIVKEGPGDLTLTGVNSYASGTLIEQGIVSVEDDANLGATTGPLTFDGGNLRWDAQFNLDPGRAITLNAGGGTLRTRTFSTTISQAITGAGGLTKAGSGTLTLDGANTYSGDTTIDNGVVRLGVANALENSTVVINDNNGLDINGIDATIGALAGFGALNLGSNTLIVGDNDASTAYTGQLSGDSGSQIRKSGAGTLTLENAGNSIDSLRASEGSLVIRDDIALGSELFTPTGSPIITDGGNLTIENGAVVSYSTTGNVVARSDRGSLTISGAGSTLTGRRFNTAGSGNGDASTLTISNDGLLDTADMVIIGFLGTTDAAVTTGGDITTGNLNLGVLTGAVGSLQVTDPGSTVQVTNLRLGGFSNAQSGGVGTLAIENGAAVTATGGVRFFGNLSSININGGTLTTGRLDEGDDSTGEISLSDPAGEVALTVGAGGNDSTFSGLIQDAAGGPGSIKKVGTGKLTLTGNNTYTGGTEIEAGTLQLGGGGADGEAGSGRILNNGALVVNRTGDFSNRVTGTGSVTYTAGSGVTSITGSNNNAYTGLTTLTGGTLELNKSGTAVPGDFLIASGTVDVLNDLQIADDSAVTNRSVFNMDGVVDVIGSLTVEDGGRVDLKGMADLETSLGNNLVISGADSEVTVQNSTLTLGGGVVIDGGGLSVDGGIAKLEMRSGNTITLSDFAARLEAINGATMDLETTGFDPGTDLIVNDGSVLIDATSSYLADGGDYIDRGGDITLLGGAARFDGEVVLRAGSLGTGPFPARGGDLIIDGSEVAVSGSWNAQGADGGSIAPGGSASGGRSGRVEVLSGLLTLDPDAVFDFRGGAPDGSGSRGAAGTLDLSGGTVTINGAEFLGRTGTPVSTDPITLYRTSINVSGGELDLTDALTIEGDGGLLNLTGGATTATTIREIDGGDTAFTGGTLQVGTYEGDLDQGGGTLVIGNSPGLTDVTGAYNQTTGALEIELFAGGVTPIAGVDFDQLNADTATLGGTLELVIDPGYTPAVGDVFDVLTTTNGLSGTFALVDGAYLGGGLGLDVSYTANDVVVEVISVALGDYDVDGDVDVADALLGQRLGEPLGPGSDWATNFGQGSPAPPTVTAVPEPSAVALSLIGACLVSRRRRPFAAG